MQKWEYRHFYVELRHWTTPPGDEGMNAEHVLASDGEKGWELVAAVPMAPNPDGEPDTVCMILKRPVYPRLDPEVEKLVRGQ